MRNLQTSQHASGISAKRAAPKREVASAFYTSTHRPAAAWQPGVWILLTAAFSLVLLVFLPMGRLAPWLPVYLQKCLLFVPVAGLVWHEWRAFCRPGRLARASRRGDVWLLADQKGRIRRADYAGFAWFSEHFCFLHLKDEEGLRIPLLLTGKSADVRRLRVWLRYRDTA